MNAGKHEKGFTHTLVKLFLLGVKAGLLLAQAACVVGSAGARVRTKGMSRDASHCSSNCICVVLPAPSSPSKEINRPLLTLCFLCLCGRFHNPSQNRVWGACPPASSVGQLYHTCRDTLLGF